MIGSDSKRELGKSVRAAGHDNDETMKKKSNVEKKKKTNMHFPIKKKSIYNHFYQMFNIMKRNIIMKQQRNLYKELTFGPQWIDNS